MPLRIDANASDFEASVVAASFDGVRLFTVQAAPHVAECTERLARTGDPHYWLGYQLDGVSTISQADAISLLRPGEFTVHDSTMPYVRTFPAESRTLVALFPQQLLPLPPRSLARVGGLRIGPNDPMGSLLGGFLRHLADELPRLDVEEGRAAVQAMIGLVVAAVALRVGEAAPRSRRGEHLVRIRDWIMSHVHEPSLDPSAIAEANFVSVRYLHSLFHDEGTTVATWVRERRLEMARRDLQSPGATDAIRDIATRWGFSDPAWFARAFRQAYGVSPRDFRAGGVLD